MRQLSFSMILVAAIGLCFVSPSDAGKIIVSGDDQTFSALGFDPPNDGLVFAQNVATFFAGGETGDFLVYSTHPALTGGDLAAAMTGAGHSWTISMAGPFDVATLLTYDAVFVGGDNIDLNTLHEYVKAGGNVFLAAGVGPAGPFGDYATEAAILNTFLEQNNLSLAGIDNGECGSLAVTGSHPIVTNVFFLNQCNGLDVRVLDPNSTDPAAEIAAPLDFGGPHVGYIGVATRSVRPTVTNDECADATPVGSGETPFSTLGATTGGPFEEFPCVMGGSDVWFRFVPACSGGVLVALCGSNFDTVLQIYDGCPTDAGQFLACNDDSCGQQSRTNWFAVRGREYFIRVGGFEGFQGAGLLTITPDYVTVPGDFNADGGVGLSDLSVLLSNFGTSEGGTYQQGDMDTDGDIDLSDLSAFLANFGLTCN